MESSAPNIVASWIKSSKQQTSRRFGLVRTLSTERRLISMFFTLPKVGQWYELKLSLKKNDFGLPAWLSPLQANGFSLISRGRIMSATPLATNDEEKRTLGQRASSAASVPRKILPRQISQACSLSYLTSLHSRSAIAVLSKVPQPDRIRVRDVGQASFVTLEDNKGKALLHFDAGIPSPFNAHTMSRGMLRNIKIHPAPVLISHWDWDHIHAGFELGFMRKWVWVAPDQPIGPSAARLAHMLARERALAIWRQGQKCKFNMGLVAQCTGTSNLNDSGIAVRVYLKNCLNVLLPGDAAYKFIPKSLRRDLSALVCTHHGGRLAPKDIPPAPVRRKNSFIISCGRRNIYAHPDREALACHRKAGWAHPQYTQRVGLVSRGDRFAPK